MAVGRRPVRWAFIFSLVLGAVIFLPFVIYGKGIFFYYGDYNVQQIPFYQLVHRSIRSGDVFWSWYTDLGANFLGSYSFYNLFSPFFWLTLPFPTAAVPYLMAPLLILKTATAAVTACLFLGRFVRDRRFAFLGALLYAFSGYTTYNIFFNHFHEVIVLFPLMLYGLELLVVERRRGVFLGAVAINCMVNYWFFIGSAMFCILYFLIRTFTGGWKMSWSLFFWALLEAVLGMVVVMVALLPSVMAIMGNPRTTPDNLLSGWEFWLYDRNQRIPAIFASIFFPPDIPSRPNFFPENGAKWASLSAWLPMIGPVFVVSYLIAAKRTWLRRLLLVCLFMAMVPGLNALFVLFNNSYYARWFYMPILLMALASAIMLERLFRGQSHRAVVSGFSTTALITLLVTAALALTPIQDEEENWRLGLYEFADRFWVYFAITALGLALCGLIIYRLWSSARGFAITAFMLAGVIATYSIAMITMGSQHSDHLAFIRETAMKGADTLSLQKNDGQFDRVDLYDDMDNLGMYWRLPNIQAFHSVVPASILEFYPSVGVKRDVSSKPQPEFFELRSLLSVRWLFVKEDAPEDKQPSTEYFKFVERQLGYNLYENQNYLPMGLPMDAFVTQEQFDALDDRSKQRLLHRAVLLTDEDVTELAGFIPPLPEEDLRGLTTDRYLQDVADLSRASERSSFVIDNRGFTHTIDLNNDSVLFYSVPFERGWKATVNGTAVDVRKVNNGFLGVPVEQGPCEVRFTFLPPGLLLGALLSLVGILATALYLFATRRLPRFPAVKGKLQQKVIYAYLPKALPRRSAKKPVRMPWHGDL